MIEVQVKWLIIILVILFLFFLLWLIYGGNTEHEFIGLKPLYQNLPDDVETILPTQMEQPIIQTLPNVSVNNIERQLSANQRRERQRIVDESKELLRQSETELRNTLARNRENIPFGKSKGERQAKKILEELYNTEFKTVRLPELRNPETKRNLEIDLYSDNVWVNGIKYKLGIEVSGPQHYNFPNFTNQTLEEFRAQVRRDLYKKDACDHHGIYLITIPYTVKDKDMREYIISMLPEVMLPENPTHDL